MWIPVTLAAATFQILRTSRQHRLAALLTTNGAGFVRYAYGAPLALAVSALWFGVAGRELPPVAGRFWLIVTLAGIAQILATVALLASFRRRDFALGTVYAKTEVIQIAVIGSVLPGEPLSPLGWLGVAACTVGVAWVAGRGSIATLARRAGDPAALLGIAAGGLFGVAAIGIRAASRSLGDAPALDRALLTLTAMLLVQTAINAAQLAATNRPELRAVALAWRSAIPVGVLSLAGSAAWALAVTLENAARVRTLGQVELLIAFAIAHLQLAERHTRREYAAAGVILAGVVVVAV